MNPRSTPSSSPLPSALFERRESVVRSYCRWFTPTLVKGSGTVVQDSEGREYLDFLAGAGALNYGHNDPDLKAALLAYLDADGIAHGLDIATDSKRSFLRAFESHILRPRGLDHRVQFTGPTGANAIEAALKLARSVTGRNNVIAFTRGFHGVSLGALSATANSYFRLGAEQGLGGITRMPFDAYFGPQIDTASLLEQMLDDPSGGIDAPAAFLLETVQGEGGLEVASPEWARRIADLAQRHGALLIVDDIQAGCGRTGTFFSFEPLGITPDLVALSKSLSGYGLPMSALLVRPQWDQWQPGQHNGTFRGNGHAFVTAAAAIQKFWTDGTFTEDIARRSRLLALRLTQLAEQVPGSRVKGRGMMIGLELDDPARSLQVREQCAHNGLIIECAGPQDEVIKFLPPLTTSDEQLHRGVDIVSDVLLVVGKGSKKVG